MKIIPQHIGFTSSLKTESFELKKKKKKGCCEKFKKKGKSCCKSCPLNWA